MVVKVDEVIEGYRAGDKLEYRFTVVDSTGALSDDENLNVDIIEPDGTKTNKTLVDAELTFISTGTYDFVKTLATAGDWYMELLLTAGQSYVLLVPVSESP